MVGRVEQELFRLLCRVRLVLAQAVCGPGAVDELVVGLLDRPDAVRSCAADG